MRRTKALEATAYHEAGHAVMAWIEGLRINKISIVPDDGSKGRTAHQNPLRGLQLDVDGSDRARLRVERAIRVALAGEIAQRHYNARSCRRHHASEDHAQATNLILRITSSTEEANAYVHLLYIQTKQALIGRRWFLVEAIARDLLERGRLTRTEIREVIRESYRRTARTGGVIRTID